MPVYHEKTETPRRKMEGSSSREPSVHRSKQRELSVERRPIISQDKPLTNRDPRKEKNKSSTSNTSSRTIKNTSKDIKPAGSTPNITKRNSSKAKEDLLKLKSRISEKSEVKKATETVKPAAQKSVPRNSNRVVEKPKSKISTEKPQTKKTVSKTATAVPTKISAPVKSKDSISFEVNDSRNKVHYRTNTRTLSPSEVKILPKQMPTEGSSRSKIQIRNERDDSIQATSSDSVQKYDLDVKDESNDDEDDNDSKSESPDAEYDDDFEDYESDFEEDSNSDKGRDEVNEDQDLKETSSVPGPDEGTLRKRIVVTSAEERERKLDSGSYHFSSGPRKKEIEQIMAAIKSETQQPRMNLNRKDESRDDIDEGYLEGATKTLKKQNSVNNIIDFSKAGKKAKELEKFEKVKRRGEEISKMITLDSITYTLMDIPAVPYDVFMATFGKSNSSQIHTQTNEDDCEEETQTEDIETTEKWTQAPVRFSPQTAADGKILYNFTKEEKLGVGGNNTSLELESVATVNQQRLQKSIANTSQRVLIWLEARQQSLISTDAKTSELSCCDGMTTTNENSEKVAVKLVVTNANNIFLTVQIMSYGESLIKVWNSLVPSVPSATLMCHQEINCACFSPGRSELVIAAANDGSVNIWDLRDSNAAQSNKSFKVLGHSPTYSTAEILKQDGHSCGVVSVLIIQKEDDQDEEFQPTQVCTLDERGHVIIWSLIQQNISGRTIPNSDLGLAPWGRIRLVKSSHFDCNNIIYKESVMATETFNSMVAKGSSGNQLLIASSSGSILHCSIDGNPLKPKLFLPSKNSKPAAVMKISIYQADERYFIAGCSDGTIRLHGYKQNMPLINLHWNIADSTAGSSVKSLEWLPSKPCMFFVLDATSRVHVWNLAVSDIYPQLVIPASNNPFSFGAVLRSKQILQRGSMVFGRANGLVEIHNTKVEFNLNERKNEWKKEMKMFQRYVKIL